MRRLLLVAAILVLAICSASLLTRRALSAPSGGVELHEAVKVPFRFVALGDTRFTESTNPEVANGPVRRAIVLAVSQEKPAFISFSGDVVYRGDDAGDWKVWDSETSSWSEQKIAVYPALGNHDLHGNEKTALSNYFQHFPDLQGNRYYSVRVANCLMLVLDSASDETGGPQGEWLKKSLDNIPKEVAFVIVVLHHPPYTSSSDDSRLGGGHSSRSREQALATLLEQKQATARARFVVFGGHVHNYERHQHGGVTYFVTGGGGAHPHLIERSPSDLFQGNGVNYHYLLAEVSQHSMKVTMRRVELIDGKPTWTEPDKVTITAP